MIWRETGTFSKLLPLAPSSNIRLVVVSRRDYASYEIGSPGSTPHTEAEIEDIKAGRGIHLQRLGLEVANFILWFTKTYKIPTISDDGKSGGVSVMGWSIGAVSPLALLAHADVIPKESKQQLASYFRQVILYGTLFLTITLGLFGDAFEWPPDAPDSALGFFFGLEDDIYPVNWQAFPVWAGRYYFNPDLTSRAGARATTVDSSKRSSLENMTDEELAVNYDLAASMKSDMQLFSHMQPALEKQTQTAFFDTTLAQEFLPALHIVWLFCPHSPWPVARPRAIIEQEMQEHLTKKHEIRLMKFIELQGANHCVSVFICHFWSPST